MNKRSILTAILTSLSLVPGLSHSAMIENLREAQAIGSKAAAQGDAAQAAARAEESFNKLPEIRFQTTEEESYVDSPASPASQGSAAKLTPAQAADGKAVTAPPALSDESGKPELKTGWAGFGRGYKIGVAKTLALWWNIMSLSGSRFAEGDASAVPGALVTALVFPIVVLAAYLPMGIMSGIKGAKYGAEAPPKFDETVKSPWS